MKQKFYILLLLLLTSYASFSQKILREYWGYTHILKEELQVNAMGIGQGFYKSYYRSGQLEKTGFFTNGNKTGLWSTFDEGATKPYYQSNMIYRNGYQFKTMEKYWFRDGPDAGKLKEWKEFDVSESTIQNPNYANGDYPVVKCMLYTNVWSTTEYASGDIAIKYMLYKEWDVRVNVPYEKKYSKVYNRNGTLALDRLWTKTGDWIDTQYDENGVLSARTTKEDRDRKDKIDNDAKFGSLETDKNYIDAEKYYASKDYLGAFNSYSKIYSGEVQYYGSTDKLLTPAGKLILSKKLEELTTKVSEIIAKHDEFWSYIKGQFDSLQSDFRFTTNSFKLNDDYYAVNNINKDFDYDNNKEKPCWWGGEATSYSDFMQLQDYLKRWSNCEKCFDKSKSYGFYAPHQIIYVKQYFSYREIFNTNNLLSTHIFFKNKNYDLYLLSDKYKNSLIDSLAIRKKEFNLSKTLMEAVDTNSAKQFQIHTLNEQFVKKILYAKLITLYSSFIAKYNNCESLTVCLNYQSKWSSVLDKVIQLYAQDTKNLEKQLKSAISDEEIQNKILGN